MAPSRSPMSSVKFPITTIRLCSSCSLPSLQSAYLFVAKQPRLAAPCVVALSSNATVSEDSHSFADERLVEHDGDGVRLEATAVAAGLPSHRAALRERRPCPEATVEREPPTTPCSIQIPLVGGVSMSGSPYNVPLNNSLLGNSPKFCPDSAEYSSRPSAVWIGRFWLLAEL